MHRHKLHRKPSGWNIIRLIERKTMIDKFNTMVVDKAGNAKNLYRSKPHFTWDNYFLGGQILNYGGDSEYCLTMTC